MKKFLTLICSLGFSVIALTIFIYSYNRILDKQIAERYKDQVAAYYGSSEKNTGLQLQKVGIERDNFMLYGSSELGSDVPQNPTRFFPVKDNPSFIVNVVGRGHTQDLEHLINFGALSKELKGKKIGFVVSIQWFLEEQGIDSSSFTMNFSELQFYKYMNNKEISKESKLYAAKRVNTLTANNKDFMNPHLYSVLYERNNIATEAGYYLFKPYFMFREQQLVINDKIKTLSLLKIKKPSNIIGENLKKVSWAEDNKIAENMGKKAVTNNKYYINDEYYNQYIKEKMNTYMDYYKGIKLDNSLENKDFEQLLKICKQLEIKPVFIIMPVNGYFYDYMALSKETRYRFYDNIESMTRKYGFEAVNLKDKEYEPYFMVDIMHLGWKGWLYVDEKIYNYYNY